MYKYFEHESDIGIIGIGKTLDEAFSEGAKAMFQVMCDIDYVFPRRIIKIKTEADDEGSLFVNWLNELLAQKDIQEMMFSKFNVKISKQKDKFILVGEAKGEKLNPAKHHLKVEVKAATYSQLKVEKGRDVKVQCVVDV